VGAYALGKAQRVIAMLRAAGHAAPIYLHGALEKLTALYASHGVALGDVRPAAGVPADALRGHVVVAPPSALADRWSRRLPDPITAFASGWMRVRARARQNGAELPLVISDHADWDALTATIRELRPREVWATHGREDALVHWCGLHQIPARALHLVGREDEAD
jgi:putative mRNA 3-end processing factor